MATENIEEKADTFMRTPRRLIDDLEHLRIYPKEPLWKVVDRIRFFYILKNKNVKEKEKGD